MSKEKTIYIVIEHGSGIVHKAFEKKSDAEDCVDELKSETGFECYEIQELEYVY